MMEHYQMHWGSLNIDDEGTPTQKKCFNRKWYIKILYDR